MSEITETMTLTLKDHWSLLVRRKWHVLASIVLGLALAAALFQVLPKTYRSEALILVEDQQMPESYVKNMVEGSVEQRIFLIQQQVMSRTRLGQIIQESGLYDNDIQEHGLDTVIGTVRGGIEIELVGGLGTGRASKRDLLSGVNAFRISFSHSDPMTAMKITEGIASKFIDENLKTREKFVEGASEFLDYELSKAKADLENQEHEISNFKSKYIGDLPQQTEANLRALDRLQSELTAVDESLQRVGDRLAITEKGIAEYQRTGAASSDLAANLSPDPLIRQLRALEEKLITLSSEYTNSYPDISLTQQEITKVKAKLLEKYGPEGGKGDKPFDPYLREIQKQRDELRSEVELLRKRRDIISSQKKEYEGRVEKSPAIEQKLLILLRDYENMSVNYRSLLDKRINAKVAENLEKRQKGEQFRILDPANLPQKPFSPNFMKLMILGFVLGCAGGFGLAYSAEMLTPTFRRPEDVERILGPQVVTMIPEFSIASRTPAYRKFLPVNGRSAERNNAEMRFLSARTMAVSQEPAIEMTMIAKSQPASIVSEQYRVAATQLTLLRSEYKTTIVAITSAVKGEGKTTTVVNLAYTLARDLGKRTVMVECDFKCPMLHQYTRVPSEPGLADLLKQQTSLDDCLHRFGDVPCWVLPMGQEGEDPNELIKNPDLVTIFNELRNRFDYIVMNTPPILPLADMNILAGFADILTLVVRAGSTPQAVVKRALSTLRHATPACTLLNAVDSTALPYYMSYDYGSGPLTRV